GHVGVGVCDAADPRAEVAARRTAEEAERLESLAKPRGVGAEVGGTGEGSACESRGEAASGHQASVQRDEAAAIATRGGRFPAPGRTRSPSTRSRSACRITPPGNFGLSDPSSFTTRQ